MKFRITMKDPDGFYDSIQVAAVESVGESYNEEEHEALVDLRIKKLKEQCKKWFDFDEYVTVEIDTDANTCVVVENE